MLLKNRWTKQGKVIDNDLLTGERAADQRPWER